MRKERTMLSEGALINAWVELRDHNPIEKTGNNDHPRIAQYLRRAGIVSNAPWCAAFVYWNCVESLGVRNAEAEDPVRKQTLMRILPSHPASVYGWKTWADQRNLVYMNGEREVRRGDLFFWLDEKTKRGHIGHIAEVVWVLRPQVLHLVHPHKGAQKKMVLRSGLYIRTYEGNGAADENSREGREIVTRWRRVERNTRFIALSDVEYPWIH